MRDILGFVRRTIPMTAQIHDRFQFRGEDFALAGISEGGLFDPSLLDLQPIGNCTACYRGYVATFTIADSRLVLDAMSVSLGSATIEENGRLGPLVNGMFARGPKEEHDSFSHHYRGLNYHLEYTGGVLLADDFINELYVHMGFHPAWKDKRVVELVFDGGILRQSTDRSEQMAEIRERLRDWDGMDNPERRAARHNDIAKFIDESFDRRYRL
jgi:hypothetical protein